MLLYLSLVNSQHVQLHLSLLSHLVMVLGMTSPCCLKSAGRAGYGDDLNIMNSIHLLQQYVERQNKIWLALEMDKGRGIDLADVEDPRVDLCLFCIQAHRLRPVDLRCDIKAHNLSFC